MRVDGDCFWLLSWRPGTENVRKDLSSFSVSNHSQVPGLQATPNITSMVKVLVSLQTSVPGQEVRNKD